MIQPLRAVKVEEPRIAISIPSEARETEASKPLQAAPRLCYRAPLLERNTWWNRETETYEELPDEEDS